MTYIIYSDIGGFLWWFLIKFCKTKLKDEQLEKYEARNILFLIVLCLLGVFIASRFFID